MHSITSVIMARSTLALRRFADTLEAAECPQAVAPVDLENTIASGTRVRPHGISIARWNMECLAAGARTSFDSLQREDQPGDGRAASHDPDDTCSHC